MGKILLCGGLAALIAFATLFGEPLFARAENLSAETASLALPGSYEQYLNLTDPVDIALSEKYIAIADGNILWIYDCETNSYSKTTLDGNGESRTISKIGFAENRLFVADTGVSNYFYEYNFVQKSFKKLSMNCSTFLIDGNSLYTATVSNGGTHIGKYVITSLIQDKPAAVELGTISEAETPSLAVLGDKLLCIFDDQVYSPDSTGKFSDTSTYYLSSDPSHASNVKGVCAYDGALYYTAQDGLYRSDSTTEEAVEGVKLFDAAGLSALTAYDGMLYAVKGNSVVGIEIGDTGVALTGYEIAAASDSVNRLSGAVDTARAGDLLVTADAGNHRVSIAVLGYTEEGRITINTCSVFPCVDDNDSPYTPTHIATDGNIIAVSSADSYIYLYHYGDESFYEQYNLSEHQATDLACMDGTCYFITESGYGKAEENFSVFERKGNIPKALAVDACGYLYVVTADGDIQCYTETTFIDPNIECGTKMDFTIPGCVSSFQADCEGNLYYLHGATLWRNDVEFARIENSSFVYGDTNDPIAFALSFEDSEVFFLYENYIVVTTPDALDIPTQNETYPY